MNVNFLHYQLRLKQVYQHLMELKELVLNQWLFCNYYVHLDMIKCFLL